MDEATSSAIDESILTGRIMPALIRIRVELGCSIPAAIDEVSQRHERLRVQRPNDFTVSREEFGRGFYS